MERKERLRKERFRRLQRRFDVLWSAIRASALRYLLICILLLAACTFIGLLFSPIIQVREIQVTRLSPRLDVEEVQEALTPLFHRHLFFLSSFEIGGLLKESIPDIDTVSIGKTYPSMLHVQIKLHPLVARLQIAEPESGDYAEIGTGTTIHFLTDQGLYIATTAAKDIETLPEIVIVDWAVPPEPCTPLLSTAFLERMNAAELTLLRQFGQEIARRTVYLRAQEFHLRIGRIALWFDLKSPLEDQLQRYRTFLREVGLEDVKQYVDLRIADRVVYQ